MNRTKLTSGGDGNNAAFYQTATFTPGANRLVLAFVANAMPTSTAANTPTLAGAGLTWEQVDVVTTSATDDFKLTCFRSMSSTPATGTVVIDFNGQKQDCCAWSIFEFDGVPTTGASGSDAVVQSSDEQASGALSLSAPLDSPVAGASQNHTVAALLLDFKRTITAGSGFTEIDVQSPTGTGRTCALQTQESTSPVQASEWKWAGGAGAAAIVLEIKAAAPADMTSPAEAFARRFEPILFLHGQEKFVPVNAERFVQQAAMWRATAPADDNNNWTNLIAAGQISTEPTASGFLGTSDNGRDCFLELGGWKDKSEAAEPDVTATSSNVYANRAEIESAYQGLDPLMTPWYHTELIDIDGMKALARQGSALPDWDALIERIGRNLPSPKLLNYYLFFPTHVQTVGTGTCGNIEAQEISCHAGDWQCISLLLTGDGTDNPAAYTPTHIGLTGLRPEEVHVADGEFRYRAYAFDDDKVTVMKVVEWQPDSNSPATIDSHPQVYVALGTHSLYVSPNDQEKLTPYDFTEWPDQCGKRDTPAPIPPGTGDDADTNPPNSLEDTLLLLAKLIGGAALGGFLGFEGGLYAATEEDVMPYLFGSPIDTSVNPVDSPSPDATSPINNAVTIRPELVSVPNEGQRQFWKSAQGHMQDDHQYDFIVDRDTQRWWPHADNEHGYFGRWGQQVAEDPLGRRSGPHFPNYIRMFLEAFESALRYPTPDFTLGP